MEKKFVYESLEELFESPDWLSADGRYDRNGYPGDVGRGKEGDNWNLDHESEDAHPFWVDEEGKFQMGPAGTMHPNGVSRKGQGMFPGRLWFYHKIMSFWEYPDKETFFDMVKKMGDELKDYYPEDEYRIINDPEWKVEIVPGDPEIIVDPTTSVVVSGPWRHTGEFQTKLIPIQDYQFGGTRTEEEIGKEHAKSPLLKKKKIPQGWGSTHPKYQERRAWNMASLTSESVNFERGQDPLDAMDIGQAAIRPTAEIAHAGDGSYVYITVGEKEGGIQVRSKYNGKKGNDLLWDDIEKKAWKMGAGKIHDSESEPSQWKIHAKNKIHEGVADKYMAKHFGLVDPEEEFDRD